MLSFVTIVHTFREKWIKLSMNEIKAFGRVERAEVSVFGFLNLERLFSILIPTSEPAKIGWFIALHKLSTHKVTGSSSGTCFFRIFK
jgi:hypothetical protein